MWLVNGSSCGVHLPPTGWRHSFSATELPVEIGFRIETGLKHDDSHRQLCFRELLTGLFNTQVVDKLGNAQS